MKGSFSILRCNCRELEILFGAPNSYKAYIGEHRYPKGKVALTWSKCLEMGPQARRAEVDYSEYEKIKVIFSSAGRDNLPKISLEILLLCWTIFIGLISCFCTTENENFAQCLMNYFLF